jgi:HK97 family phage major capsid protein
MLRFMTRYCESDASTLFFGLVPDYPRLMVADLLIEAAPGRTPCAAVQVRVRHHVDARPTPRRTLALNQHNSASSAALWRCLLAANRVIAPHKGAPDKETTTMRDEIIAAIDGLTDAVDAHRGQTNKAIQGMQAQVDDLGAKWLGTVVGGSAKPSAQHAAAYELLGRFARLAGQSDLAQFSRMAGNVKNTMFVGSDPDGGWLDLPTVDPNIRRIQQNVSPLRGLANIVTINSGEYQVLLDPSMVASGWVGEQQSRPTTDASKLVKIIIPACEVYAAPAATQSVLDDSFIDLGAWLTGSVEIAFAAKEGTAFVSGDGVLKPRGFLTYGLDSADDFTRDFTKLQYIPTGSTTPTATQLADAILSMSCKLRAPYRANAVWLMNRATMTTVRQLKDTSFGLLLWSTDGRIVDGIPDRLLGFPVAICEDMPSTGANALPIAFGDFRQGYTIVDRIGIRVLRDPYTSRPYVIFYCTRRVGGAVTDTSSIKILKYSNS